MDLGSKGKHMSVPMSANFPENSMGATAKGLSSSNISTNLKSGSTISNLNTSSNLSQANLFRPADTQYVGGLQEGRDNISSVEKNASANKNSDNDDDNNTDIRNLNSDDNNKDNTNKDNSHISISISSGIKFISDGVRYKECLKNHAANMGGYAVDGCGEFMPAGEEGSLEALKCAACGCHRNFHRREISGGSSTAVNTNMSLLALPSPLSTNNTSTSANNEYGEGDRLQNVSGGVAGTSGGFGPSHYSIASPVSTHHHHGMPGFLPHLHHHHHHQYMHSLMGSKLVQGGHGGAGAMQLGGHHMGAAGGHMSYSTTHGSGGKRFRTKFTMEQREKMYEFSEKVGWRIQKQDEAAVQQFCNDAGVKRHVLKVWMHNNKNSFGKKLLRFPEAFNALPESST